MKNWSNINIKEEAQKGYTKNPMYQTHQKLYGDVDDLHMALKSCTEIGTAKTIYQFIIDLKKIS